jgi:hypothetical protein
MSFCALSPLLGLSLSMEVDADVYVDSRLEIAITPNHKGDVREHYAQYAQKGDW